MRTLDPKVGTPFYVAPEVVRGGGYGLAADAWCLGCLLYELATSRSPFDTTAKNCIVDTARANANGDGGGRRGKENDARRSDGANGDVVVATNEKKTTTTTTTKKKLSLIHI